MIVMRRRDGERIPTRGSATRRAFPGESPKANNGHIAILAPWSTNRRKRGALGSWCFYLLLIAALSTQAACRSLAVRTMLASPENVVHEVHRRLYLDPPPPALIPELYEFLLVLWDRDDEMPAAWGAYVYTTYYVDAWRKRPDGVPRLNKHAMNERIDRDIEFFYIRVRPTPTPR